MALLKPTFLFSITRRSIGSSHVLGAYWNKDWEPGPYPRTEEEKAAAAKKYGLLKEEYIPIPDDGDGAGDYPAFKPYSVEGRDPHYPWDFPEYRRNFNEAMHENFNMYTEEKYNVERKLRYPMSAMLAAFLGVMGGTFFLVDQCKYTAFLPAMPRHLPEPGVSHYKYSRS
uniref:NADH dehydrogenase [ubiquinone] 1 beta subcomplex subunit 8, mitochondrial n=1 Tax=Lygus hesperus TaxID=30085 RepID=A0A0A9X8M2_LYGHE